MDHLEEDISPRYIVIICDGNGPAEDIRGIFDSFEAAYAVFEESVKSIDEMASSVDDYPLTLDIVRLHDHEKTIMSWQRPPWRTTKLLREWAKRHGYGNVETTDIRFKSW